MRIVYFCTSGDMSILPLRHLAEAHDVLAIVRPGAALPRGMRPLLGRLARTLARRPPNPLEAFAHASGIPSLRATSGRDTVLLSQLAGMQPDLICMATFRWLLAPEVYTLPKYGTLNLHPSLLPRHRGPVPLFWIYYHNDHQTGVTVHYVNERADAGDIVCQEAFAVSRGMPVAQLHHENARRGALLLAQAVAAIQAGTARRTPQDDALATQAPRVRPGARMVQFATWDVERVWHFLAGLHPRFIEPLMDRDGQPIRYDNILDYASGAHTRPFGSLERTSYGCDLYCLGGFIRLGLSTIRTRHSVRG